MLSDGLPRGAVVVLPLALDEEVQVGGEPDVVGGVRHMALLVESGNVSEGDFPTLLVDPAEHLPKELGEEALGLTQRHGFFLRDSAYSSISFMASSAETCF